MTGRLFRRGMVGLVFGVLVALPMTIRVDARQKVVPNVTGQWKLNTEASVNPNGPPPAQAVTVSP